MSTAATLDPTPPAGQREKKPKKPWWKDWPSLALALIGVLLLAYPLTVTYLKNVGQQEVADAYNSSVTELDTQEQQYWLDRARTYNQNVASMPILDPWLSRVAKDNAPYRTYLDELNPTADDEAPIGVVTVPSIQTKLPIYHGTDASSLDRGVGHLYGSALPVGGKGMHSVLTAHSGLIEATMFDHLQDVQEGDDVYIEVMGETLKYRVYDIEVVLPEEVSSLQPESGRDLLTLITCTPYGVNTHRLLVHAERVPLDAADKQVIEDTKPQVWRTWMTAVLAILILAVAAHIWLGARKRKKKKGEAGADTSAGDSAAAAAPNDRRPGELNDRDD